MSGPELKNCPFCGGEAQLFGQIPAYCGAKVSCTECEAEGSSFRVLNNCDDANKSAIAAWNRRTPDPAQIRADAIREALDCAPEPEPADYDEYDLHSRFNEGFDAGLNFARSRILAILATPLSPTDAKE